MLKIWGRNNSLNVQKVLLCCTELGLPFERVDAGMAFGVVKTPEYMSMNPNSVVPTIDDDGFVLLESNVIVRYLCAKYSAGRLWPTDPQVRADVERWMDWQQTTFNGPLTQVFWGTVREPGAVPESEIEKARARLGVTTSMLEARLDGRAWLSGAGVGIVARSPLAYGLLADGWSGARRFSDDDHRLYRWTPKDLAHRMKQRDTLRQSMVLPPIASLREAALRYVLANGLVSVVTPGARTPDQATENVRAVEREPMLPESLLGYIGRILDTAGIER